MKLHTVTTYSAAELRAQHPDGFARALSHWQNRGEIFWQDEIIDSLKAALSAAGVKLRDWSLGAYNHGNHIEIEFPGDDATGELTGKRAFAWLENNLFSGLRVSYQAKNRWQLAKYNGSYRSCHPAGSPVLQSYTAGRVPPCPLTGYCADEDYLEHLTKAIRDGETLKEAFEGLADVCARLLESEAEDQASPDYFCEHAEANDYEFTEDGEMF